jgi:hypothetical protein
MEATIKSGEKPIFTFPVAVMAEIVAWIML